MDRVAEWQQWLDNDLPRQAGEHEVPGVSVAVLADDQVIESAAGVVNLRTGVEVVPEAVFMIQSITKVWTATLVMQLVDDGLIDLDVPVHRYLAAFRTADQQASEQITVRHLLTHTGGFEGDIWAPTTAGDDALQKFVESLVPYAEQRTQPGRMYSYCSAGCGVLGRLVEVMRDLTYEQALRRYVVEPLGIGNLAFSADQALAFRTAIGHVRPTSDADQQPLKEWAVMPPSNPAAGNQLAMSARSLLEFGRMHVSDGKARGGRVLSHDAARMMQQPQVYHPAAIGAPSSHGLGWSIRARDGVVEHGGGTIGVASLLRLVPERDIAIAVLANGGDTKGLINAIVDPLLHDLAGVEPEPVLAPGGAVRLTEPGRYLGRYQTRVATYDVTSDREGRLWLTDSPRNEALTMAETAGIPAQPRRDELRPVHDDIFVLTAGIGEVVKAVEFIGTDMTGRAQLLHTGRVAPRVR